MAITFAVDDVIPATAGRPTQTLRELAGDVLALGGDPEVRVIDHEGVHPLLAAVHTAFAEHRPLVLTPDALWLTIAQGVAQHVRLHANELRPRLVRHSGKEVLIIEVMGPPPRDPAGIEAMVDAFRAALAERIGEGRARLFVCDFSTTTKVERVASEVVLLDAFSPYFDLKMMCICGIPAVTLLGTAADYRAIRERIDVVCELDLGFWHPSLVRIADELVASAEGRPDRDFWRGIYKPKKAYGWDTITGWIARLYPYVRSWQRVDQKNPLFDVPFDYVPPKSAEDSGPFYNGPGVTTRDVPSTLARALIDVHDRTQKPPKRFNFCIEAGLTHIEQDAQGRLIPSAGYWMRERERSIHEVIERICAEHATAPAEQACPSLELPAEVIALHDRIGSATLFEGPRAWRLCSLEAVGDGFLRPKSEIESQAERHGIAHFTLVPLFELSDGRILCAAAGAYAFISTADVKHDPGGTMVPDQVTGLLRPSPPRFYTERLASEIPIVGRSLAELLSRVLDSGPDVDLPTEVTLADLREY
jgi:hypothetical protein